MQILRRGSEGDEVRRWQHFLLGQGLLAGGIDGIFGPVTEAATRTFQRRERLDADGAVGPRTLAKALERGFDLDFTDPLGGTSGAEFPPRASFVPLTANAERQEIFGKFPFERIAPGKDAIRILGEWAGENLVSVVIPQLRGIEGAPKNGRIRVHRLVQEQCRELFAAWERERLLGLLRTWDGGFVPRFVRGSSTTLSNHAWGTAFDINAAWNPRGVLPPLRGEEGSVRELVAIAHGLGFFWGGHFSRRDGMHFEVARVLG